VRVPREARREKRERKQAKKDARALARRGARDTPPVDTERRRVTQFEGSSELEEASELGYEQMLEALSSLTGRPVLVLFSNPDGSPFTSGISRGGSTVASSASTCRRCYSC
jgi:hypothetical protein